MNINFVIASNLFNYRSANHLSLDEVSNMTDVSKNMLYKIEKGESNPTIATLFKLANGLHIPLSQLITHSDNIVSLIAEKDIIPIYNQDRTVGIYPYFPYNSENNFEMFKMKMEPNSKMSSVGHFNNSEEYIIMIKGELQIEINKDIYIVKENHAIHFESNEKHIYRNKTDEELILIATIQYKN